MVSIAGRLADVEGDPKDTKLGAHKDDIRDRGLAKRRNQNLLLRQETWRNDLKFKRYLRNILEVDDILKEKWKSLDTENIQALRARADINFRLMNKLLPDLKQMDVTSAGGQVGNVGIALINAAPSEEAWVEAASSPPRIVHHVDGEVVEDVPEKKPTTVERT